MRHSIGPRYVLVESKDQTRLRLRSEIVRWMGWRVQTHRHAVDGRNPLAQILPPGGQMFGDWRLVNGHSGLSGSGGGQASRPGGHHNMAFGGQRKRSSTDESASDIDYHERTWHRNRGRRYAYLRDRRRRLGNRAFDRVEECDECLQQGGSTRDTGMQETETFWTEPGNAGESDNGMIRDSASLFGDSLDSGIASSAGSVVRHRPSTGRSSEFGNVFRPRREQIETLRRNMLGSVHPENAGMIDGTEEPSYVGDERDDGGQGCDEDETGDWKSDP